MFSKFSQVRRWVTIYIHEHNMFLPLEFLISIHKVSKSLDMQLRSDLSLCISELLIYIATPPADNLVGWVYKSYPHRLLFILNPLLISSLVSDIPIIWNGISIVYKRDCNSSKWASRLLRLIWNKENVLMSKDLFKVFKRLSKNLQVNVGLKNRFLSYSSILKIYPWEQLKYISFYSNFL
jgi:hypothetical protein